MFIFQLVWIVIAYVLGSIPFGLVIAKTFCNIDPRTGGSHSVGATNVARLCGVWYGIATLACDVGKGLLPVWGALLLSPDSLFVSIVGLACVVGHVFSCFLQFSGGKAVATSIGVFIPLAFWPLLGSCALGMLVIWRCGFVSLGSLCLLGSLPIFLIFCGAWQWVPLSLCLCVIVFVKHRENIERLRNGTEKPWLKKKDEAADNLNKSEAGKREAQIDYTHKDYIKDSTAEEIISGKNARETDYTHKDYINKD